MTIYTNNMVKEELENITNLNRDFNNLKIKSKNCIHNIDWTIGFFEIASFISVLFLLYNLWKKKKISAKISLSIILMLTYYYRFCSNLSQSIPTLLWNMTILKDGNLFLKELTLNSNKKIKKNRRIKLEKVSIEFQNVTFSYNKDSNKVFNNLSIKLSNKLNGIYGRSGSGKTTLIKLMLGFYNINKGQILYNNTNIYDLDIEYLRKNISYVNQNTKLFNYSVLKNIKYSNKATYTDVKFLINKYKLELILPDLSKNVGINGNNLSGGQKQVVLILRAILKKSKIYFFDEPTSALDSITFNKILNIINDLKNKATVIIVTHDKD